METNERFDVEPPPDSSHGADEVPAWCNVLEGLSAEQLAEFEAVLRSPVRLASLDDFWIAR